MNRAQRRRNSSEHRREGWSKLSPHLDYDALVAEVRGSDELKLMMVVMRLRQLVGEECRMSDREVWDGLRDLTTNGLLNIYFRFGAEGIEIRSEVLMPGNNDTAARPHASGVLQ